MTERQQIEDEQFKSAVCAHIMQAACANSAPECNLDLALARHDGIQISRLRSVRRIWNWEERRPRHTSCEQLVVYIQTRGSSVQFQDGRELYLREGEMTCTDTSRPFKMQFRGDFEQLLVHLPRSLVTSLFGSTEAFTVAELSRGNQLGTVVAPFLRNVNPVFDKLHQASAGRLVENAASLVLTLLAERASKPIEDPALLKSGLRFRAEEFIRRNSHNRELRPKHVAKALNVSLRHLQEIFQGAGTTASALIWDCRLRTSQQDLSNSILASLNITEIAFRSGFGDTAHFSRRFKDRYGMTPRDFRFSYTSAGRSSAFKDTSET